MSARARVTPGPCPREAWSPRGPKGSTPGAASSRVGLRVPAGPEPRGTRDARFPWRAHLILLQILGLLKVHHENEKEYLE